MRLLFVTSLVPCGTSSTGYEIANEAIIDGLRRVGADVTVIGFVWPGKQPSEPDKTIVLGKVDVRTEGAHPLTKIKWVASAVTGGFTISSVKMRLLEEAVLKETIRKHGPFEAYVLNGVSLPGAFLNAFSDLPSIWIAHNVEYVSSQENARSADSALKRALFKRDARILYQLERDLAARARYVFTLAEEDRAPLGLASRSRSAALPLVIAKSAMPTLARRKIEWDAGLIGTWTWQPNRVGLEWFIREVAPLLPNDLKIAVAGSMPAGLPSAPANVSFLGRVPDAREFVNSCAVIPLVARGGTGVQLKTIETFEAGLPSVATTLSLRGVDWKPQNCLVSDDPAEFARLLALQARGVRDGTVADCDGNAFLQKQREALDHALAKGLASLQKAEAGVAA